MLSFYGSSLERRGINNNFLSAPNDARPRLAAPKPSSPPPSPDWDGVGGPKGRRAEEEAEGKLTLRRPLFIWLKVQGKREEEGRGGRLAVREPKPFSEALYPRVSVPV